jgi:cytochrome P450
MRHLNPGRPGLTVTTQTSIAVCNHAFHHNPDVFGVDHNVFDPTRWDQPEIANKSKLLMHFGLGGRQCIGKTVAMTNIYKLMSTLLSEFEFELVDEKERDGPSQNESVGDVPELISVGISDLARPLLVKASKRTRVSS